MSNNLHQFINKKFKSTPINKDGSFKFTCAENCWGTCCRKEHAGLLQLSVYDVYKLISKRPDLTTLSLIDVKIDEETNLPRAYIKWTEDGTCPNLEENGACKVYNDRPFACRIFPLEAKFMIDDSKDIISVDYAVKENVCFGFHKEANPLTQTLKKFLDTPDFDNHLKYEKQEIFLRDKWLRNYPIKELNQKQVHTLAQTLYCLKEKIAGKNTYFFDVYSEMLKIPKRTKRIESLSVEELTILALKEFTPRMLEKFDKERTK